jgi:hypothetical protein
MSRLPARSRIKVKDPTRGPKTKVKGRGRGRPRHTDFSNTLLLFAYALGPKDRRPVGD